MIFEMVSYSWMGTFFFIYSHSIEKGRSWGRASFFDVRRNRIWEKNRMFLFYFLGALFSIFSVWNKSTYFLSVGKSIFEGNQICENDRSFFFFFFKALIWIFGFFQLWVLSSTFFTGKPIYVTENANKTCVGVIFFGVWVDFCALQQKSTIFSIFSTTSGSRYPLKH